MSAVSRGYVAVGLSAGGSNPMVSSGQGPSDIIMGWYDPASATVQVQDYFATAYAQPTMDFSSDVSLVAGGGYNASSGVLSVPWFRALSTGDEPYDRPITPGTPQVVLWALNRNPGAVTSPDGSSFLQHEVRSRGYATINFGAPAFRTCAAAMASTCPSHGSSGGGGGSSSSFATLQSQCLGNGWPRAEAAGDRDGGAATPPALPAPVVTCLTSPDGVLSVGWRIEGGTLLRVSMYNRAGEGGEGAGHPPVHADDALHTLLLRLLLWHAGGWAGFGFNTRQSMTGADTIIVRG
jgi:hypothetical protein